MHTVKFETTNDFELDPNGIARESEYKICNISTGNGLVVYIPGFGGDLGGYTDTFCQKISEKYPEYAAASVDYFCMRSRPQVGGEVYFEHEDQIKSNTLNLPQSDILSTIYKRHKMVTKPTFFTAGLNPPNGEYQNFGIMAAIDVINACVHAIHKFNLDPNNVILVGSSYGGYVANLVTKIAPGFIRAVFDNSSWANVNLNYVVGRELNAAEFTLNFTDNLHLNLFVKSPWTLKSGLSNSFANEKIAIRNFGYSDLMRMIELGGDRTCYLFYHAMNDKVADTNEKMDMARNMIQLGFMVSMEVFEEQDIDGEFIKSLEHGMGLSMLTFFEKGIDFINSVNRSFCHKSNSISIYEYGTKQYKFDLTSFPLKAQLLSN